MNIDDLPTHKVIVAGGAQRSNEIYHTTNCGRHPANVTTMDRAMADAWGFRKCRLCDGGGPSDEGRTVDYSYQDALKEAARDD